jgi:hypothetical protein
MCRATITEMNRINRECCRCLVSRWVEAKICVLVAFVVTSSGLLSIRTGTCLQLFGHSDI